MLLTALIDPRRHWQAYRALGRLLQQRRELAWELTKHEISERYAGQVFGTLWAVGHPLIMVAIYVVVFGRILAARRRRSRDGSTRRPSCSAAWCPG